MVGSLPQANCEAMVTPSPMASRRWCALTSATLATSILMKIWEERLKSLAHEKP